MTKTTRVTSGEINEVPVGIINGCFNPPRQPLFEIIFFHFSPLTEKVPVSVFFQLKFRFVSKFICLLFRDEKTGFINWELPTAFNMEKLVKELENNTDLKKQDRLPNLKTNWQISEVFESKLSFHDDFLAQVEDLRKASLVFVEGILGTRQIIFNMSIVFW